MTDSESHADPIRRTLGRRVLEAGEARVLTIARSYPTSLADLWEACTDPERIPRWFLPVSGELKVGGRYQLEGNAGGTIEACDPPHSFAATWEHGGDVSWIELQLTAEGPETTRFELRHIAHVDDERWTQYGPGAVGVGWDLALLGLGMHLDGGGVQVDPAAAQAWVGSSEGVAYLRESADAWGEADAADGGDAAVAAERAERTYRFYTGT
ncbi:SRPBCC family protein [Conexibacter sp. JD483]|uniref:SRPBCC family protein n=1 Tax=unclassified Conexibacter TaxID=2627773 RepID=UPI00271D2EE9|nr:MULTISPECIES: SRPBCC family protein [unclassified Conexibacter]MDO8185555.1 SRPBCC family protein [Conexibacter sp. CPCC 205706]MDO8197258.1 SRPBCC family protein [Conexibacter sp. CPCC 205762]MDR9371539.1 SRPBCC family protein [Conexibacter sp. JD483]